MSHCSKPSLMQILIVFGKIIVVHPLESNPHRRAFNALFIFLQLITAIFYTAIYSDTILSNSLRAMAGSNLLSLKLETLASVFLGMSADTTIRITCLLHREEIRYVTTILGQRRDNNCPKHHRILFLAYCFIGVWAMSSYACAFKANFAVQIPATYKMTLIPFGTLITVRLLYCFADLLFICSSAYALLFTFSFGLMLIDWLTSYTDKISSLHRNKPAFCVNENQQPSQMNTELMVQEFQQLKSCFETYGKIAGGHCMALMTCFVLGTIEFLSSVVTAKEEMSSEVRDLRIIGSFSIIMIILVSYFGSYITKMISAQQDIIRQVQVKSAITCDDQIGKLSGWVLSWNWKLTAADLFDVNLGVLPGIVATIITYFIFIFQLKTSERDEAV